MDKWPPIPVISAPVVPVGTTMPQCPTGWPVE